MIVCACVRVHVWWVASPSTVVEILINSHCVPVPGSQIFSCLLASTAYWFIMSHFVHSQGHLLFCLGPPLCLMGMVFPGQPFAAANIGSQTLGYLECSAFSGHTQHEENHVLSVLPICCRKMSSGVPSAQPHFSTRLLGCVPA